MLSLSDFVVKYGDRSAELGVPIEDLYQALVDTATNAVISLSVMKSRHALNCFLARRLELMYVIN